MDAERRRYSPEELKEILRLHEMWRRGWEGGKQANLCHANLKRADLRNADLRNIGLAHASFFAADLRGASLENAMLENALFAGADLRGANLANSDLHAACFTEARLQKAIFSCANLTGANINSAVASGADFSRALLYQVDLSDTDLSYADLRQSFLPDAWLKGVNLFGALLDGAILPPDFVLPGAASAKMAWEKEYSEANGILSKLLAQGSPDRRDTQELLDLFWVYNVRKSLNKAAPLLGVHRRTVGDRIENLEVNISTPEHRVVLVLTSTGMGPRNNSHLTEAGVALVEWLEANEEWVWKGFRRTRIP